MEARDAYKLIYQASCGMRHLFHSSHAHVNFDSEYLIVKERADIALFEKIHPDEELFRINLARAKREGIDKDFLWKKMLESALAVVPDKDNLVSWWEEFEVSTYGRHIFGMDAFKQQLEASGFKAFHHSEHYRKAYKPSYRLITKEIAENITSLYFLC